jgi:proteic killer suppression protein
MIKLFRSRGLKELHDTGSTAKIDSRMHQRIIRRLDALKQARRPEDMNLPGFDFHPLQGFRPTRYTVHVNGPWCITFEFEDEQVTQVDYEQYH